MNKNSKAVLIRSLIGFLGVLFFSLRIATVAHADITSNLFAHWKFDEGSGTTAADDTGNGNTATLNGATTWTTGKIGPYAVSYNGANGNGTSFSSFSSGTTFTYAAWIYLGTNGTAYQNLFTQAGTAGFWIFNRKIDFYFGGDHLSNTTITSAGWHHIAVVDNATAVTFYLDGVADGTATIGSSFSPSGMGCDGGTGNECFVGFQDDVRFYTRALSSSDITELYAYGIPVTKNSSWVTSTSRNFLSLSNGLVGWWTFDGKDLVSNAVDKSGNGYTGYLQSFTSTSSAITAGKIGQALKFNGTDYVTTQAQLAIKGQPAASIAFWAKSNFVDQRGVSLVDTHVSSNQVILDYEISGNADSVIRCTTASGASCTLDGNHNPWLTNANWHHIVVTYDGTPKLYVDGALDSTGSPTGQSLETGGFEEYFRIGQTWQGSIDDVRVYNRALSATEAAELYTVGTATHVGTSLPGSNGKNSLVGWWTFDGKDLVSNVKDRSGNGNTGYLQSFTSTSSAITIGKIGQALKFDGTADYVSTPLFNTGATAVTYSAWVKLDSRVNYQTILTTNSFNNDDSLSGMFFGGPCCGFNSSSEIVLQINTSVVVTSGLNFPVGVWKHVVGTWSASGGSHIYVDGVDQSLTGTITESSIQQNYFPYKLGATGKSTISGFLHGSLDDVRIYNRALSAAEVQKLAGNPLARIKAPVLIPCVASYANHGGTGDRRPGLGLANIYVTSSGSDITPMQGGGGSADSAWVDGDNTSNGHGFFSGSTLNGTQWLEFDFGPGASALITEAKYYQQDSTAQGTWEWQGSNDNSTWTTIGGSFKLGGVPIEQIATLSGNAKKYRYYRMLGLSGTTSALPWLYEMEFKICGLP